VEGGVFNSYDFFIGECFRYVLKKHLRDLQCLPWFASFHYLANGTYKFAIEFFYLIAKSVRERRLANKKGELAFLFGQDWRIGNVNITGFSNRRRYITHPSYVHWRILCGIFVLNICQTYKPFFFSLEYLNREKRLIIYWILESNKVLE
jgi:hypothetical protein